MAASAPALATVTEIGPFHDNLEPNGTSQGVFTQCYDRWGDGATACSNLLHVTGSWSFQCLALPPAPNRGIMGSIDGPITMTFTDEGTYTRNGSVSCSAGALSAAGTLATSGSYRTSGDALTVADTRNDGTISLGGRAVPFPDAFGDGDATYAIEGSTLRITFGGPGVGTVTQTYRRP